MGKTKTSLCFCMKMSSCKCFLRIVASSYIIFGLVDNDQMDCYALVGKAPEAYSSYASVGGALKAYGSRRVSVCVIPRDSCFTNLCN